MSQFRPFGDIQIVHDLLSKMRVDCEYCTDGRDGMDDCHHCHGEHTVPKYPDGLRTWTELRWSWPMIVYTNISYPDLKEPELWGIARHKDWLPALTAEQWLSAYCEASGWSLV